LTNITTISNYPILGTSLVYSILITAFPPCYWPILSLLKGYIIEFIALERGGYL